ncbi:MAG: hypothetical protein KJO21_10390 [Verrucomicrobiae bacterium]|nr:hypothetical protein [Verrucomicrobiae bacterium]NNJ43879.1 hypothetical protein [Akkermansiaceae bacterium]
MKIHILILLLVLGASALAQNAQGRTYRVLFPEQLKIKDLELYLFNGQNSEKIQPLRKTLSPIYQLPGGEITLKLTLNQVNQGETFPQETASAEISSDTTDLLLLILNDPGNANIPLKMVIIDIGDQQLKAGETLWLNQTKNTIHASLGNQNLVIEPESRIVSKPPSETSGYYKASFGYQLPKSEATKAVMRKSWWHDATSKSYGFVIKNARSTLPTIFTVRDRR